MARRQHGHELTDRLNGVALDVYHSFHDKYRRTRATHDALMPENLVPTMRFMMDVQGKAFDEQDESLLTEVAHEYALDLLRGRTAPSSGSIQSRIQRRISGETIRDLSVPNVSWFELAARKSGPDDRQVSDGDSSVIEPRPRTPMTFFRGSGLPSIIALDLSKLADEASAVADFPEVRATHPNPSRPVKHLRLQGRTSRTVLSFPSDVIISSTHSPKKSLFFVFDR